MGIFRPRTRGGLALRFSLLAVLVTGSVAATAAVAGLLQVNTLTGYLGANKAIVSSAIKIPKAGAPQTILLIGSDHRAGEPFRDANTDTMLLVRLNGGSSTINVMSLPRDLQVDIPGFGTSKLNAAYSDGGWNLLIKTIQRNVFPKFQPNHIVDVNFSGFADLVDAIGCVYSDIDHRYYNQSEPAPSPDNYASINIEPGYQKLCGGNNQTNGALSFVRFRHTDTDLVREARQQDFIRWAKSQYSIGDLVSSRNRLLKIFGRHSQSDRQLHTTDGFLKVFDLIVNMESKGATIKQLPFPATLQPCTPTACYVTSTQSQERSAWAQFTHVTPAKLDDAATPGAGRRHGHRHPQAPSTAGLQSDIPDGVAQARALSHARMPVYFPRLIDAKSVYCSSLAGNCDNIDESAAAYAHSYPRSYPIIGPGGTRYHAFRITLTFDNNNDWYYGVQGTTWNNPPILSSPSATKVVHGRKLFLYKDGSKLTQVAWHHDGAAYWVSNTLTENLTNDQMIEIAASLTRYNG